jgi:hypothetical protein
MGKNMQAKSIRKTTYRPRKINPPVYSLADQWAKMYGETVTQQGAAKMLGVSRWTIYTHVDAGHFKKAHGTRLFTRSIAEYVETQGQKQK